MIECLKGLNSRPFLLEMLNFFFFSFGDNTGEKFHFAVRARAGFFYDIFFYTDELAQSAVVRSHPHAPPQPPLSKRRTRQTPADPGGPGAYHFCGALWCNRCVTLWHGECYARGETNI